MTPECVVNYTRTKPSPDEYPEYLDHSSHVVMTREGVQTSERDTHVKQNPWESGQLDDTIDVGHSSNRDRMSNDGPFKIVRTREEVTSTKLGLVLM